MELTHDVALLPALLASSIAAEAVTVLLLRRSILTEKVARRGFHLSREYMVDPLELARVRDVMDRAPSTVPADLSVAELARRIGSGDPDASRHQGIPIVDGAGKLAGIITRGDVMRSLRERPTGDVTVLEAGERVLIVAHPDETVREALVKMLRRDVGRLPVVRPEDPRQLVGYLGRAQVMSARMGWYRSEHARARGSGEAQVAVSEGLIE